MNNNNRVFQKRKLNTINNNDSERDFSFNKND